MMLCGLDLFLLLLFFIGTVLANSGPLPVDISKQHEIDGDTSMKAGFTSERAAFDKILRSSQYHIHAPKHRDSLLEEAAKHSIAANAHFQKAAGHYTEYVIPDSLFVVRVESSL